MSLPSIFRTTLESVPAEVPYLDAEPPRVDAWRARHEESPGLRIGVAWQGNPKYRGDRQRSIPLRFFEPLARHAEVRLLGLQLGLGSEQIEEVAADFTVETLPDLDRDGGAFMDTAAVIESLDIVITSDTAVAHLAGALGCPVWVALPHVADWRWMNDRETLPWYPTMRLFLQPTRGDWAGVFATIAAEFAVWRTARNPR